MLSPEDTLHLLLGRWVRALASLDYVVGLQLRWFGNSRDKEIAASLDATSESFHARLRKLKALTLRAWGNDPIALDAFTAWFSRAEAARGIRHDYARGRWAPHDATSSDFNFSPLSWEVDPARQPPSIRVALDALAVEVEETGRLSRQFVELQQRFGSFCDGGEPGPP